MKQVIFKHGIVEVEDVPVPHVEPGTVLVHVVSSCISVGTEISGVKASGVPIWKRALKQPDKVKLALRMMATEGFTHTRALIRSKFDAGQPTGYSAAGVVLEVGDGIDDLIPGDRVACSGAQCAYHAEVIRVPRNLVTPVPEKLDISSASTVTLGAIALQGVRRAQPTLGETFVVVGLGVVGQLTAQLLRVNGCRVIGTDIDRSRMSLAMELGMDMVVHPDDGDQIEQVARLSNGMGADGVIITASTPSDEVISTAFGMCRKKGRVVLVGEVGLNLDRRDFYYKELDFFISTSYGPGRYDRRYEEEGLDYPVGHVRWTENRNMGEYLRLLGDAKVDVQKLIGATYKVEDATEAYESLKESTAAPMVLLSYPKSIELSSKTPRVTDTHISVGRSGKVRIALIGAGEFAKFMHLPNIKSLPEYFDLKAIVSNAGHNSNSTAKQFNANYSTTDYQQVLNDPEVDAVLITTRHNLHTALTMDALKAGKHVLVEKPLSINRTELERVRDFYLHTSDYDYKPILMTGFNRRFSSYARRIYDLTTARSSPMIMNYRMNAGYIALDHWVHGQEGGGRNLGEACHIYDLFLYLTGSRHVKINAQAIAPTVGYYTYQDNFVATISFEDGSVATLTYTSLGSNSYPKESLEIFVDGKVLELSDYTKLTVAGIRSGGLKTRLVDKGHKKELEAFAKAVQLGGEWPIPLYQQIEATEIALSVENQLRGSV